MGTFKQYGTFGCTSNTLYSGGAFRDGMLLHIAGGTTGGAATSLPPYRLPQGGGASTQFGPTGAYHPLMSALHYWHDAWWLFGGFGGNWGTANNVWKSVDAGRSFANTGTTLPVNVGSGASFIYNNVAYVVGGIIGNVWSYPAQMYRSYDGVNWTTHTTSGFTGRIASAHFVWQGKMWIIGGSGASVYTDVLSSVDGITWTTHPKLSPIPHAYGHTMGWCAFDDRIIIAGGDNTGGAAILYGNYHEGTEDGGWGSAIPLPYPSGSVFGSGLLMGHVDNPELGFVGGGLRDNSTTVNTNILVYTNYKPSVLRNLNGRVSLSGERRSS